MVLPRGLAQVPCMMQAQCRARWIRLPPTLKLKHLISKKLGYISDPSATTGYQMASSAFIIRLVLFSPGK